MGQAVAGGIAGACCCRVGHPASDVSDAGDEAQGTPGGDTAAQRARSPSGLERAGGQNLLLRADGLLSSVDERLFTYVHVVSLSW